MAGDDRAMNFVRPVVDPSSPFKSIERRQHGVVGDAERTMSLNRAINDLREHIGHEELDRRDFDARGTSSQLINLPTRM